MHAYSKAGSQYYCFVKFPSTAISLYTATESPAIAILVYHVNFTSYLQFHRCWCKVVALEHSLSPESYRISLSLLANP
jgi:hypothetical protein